MGRGGEVDRVTVGKIGGGGRIYSKYIVVKLSKTSEKFCLKKHVS